MPSGCLNETVGIRFERKDKDNKKNVNKDKDKGKEKSTNK